MKDSPPSPFMSNRIQDSMARRGMTPQEQSQPADTRRKIAALTSEPIGDHQARQRRLHAPAEDRIEDEAAARLDNTVSGSRWPHRVAQSPVGAWHATPGPPLALTWKQYKVFAPAETKEALEDQVAQLTECNRRQQATITYLRRRLRDAEDGGHDLQGPVGRPTKALHTPFRRDLNARDAVERDPSHGRSLVVASDDDIPF